MKSKIQIFKSAKFREKITSKSKMRKSLFCPKLIVSKNTAHFIGCINSMQNLYSQVYEALKNIYSIEVCEELINTQFYDEFKALELCVQEFLMLSIKENLGATNQTKI